MLDSVKIERDHRQVMDTSSVDVSTIVPGMRGGGNRSRISVVPKRQRYSVTKKPKQMYGGGREDQLASEDVRYVRNMIYQRQHGGTDQSNPPTGPVQMAPVAPMEVPSPGNDTFSPTSPAVFTDEDVNATSSLIDGNPMVNAMDNPTVNSAPIAPHPYGGESHTVDLDAEPIAPVAPQPTVAPVASQPTVVSHPLPAPAGQSGGHSIQNEITTIRRLIDNTMKQRGGDGPSESADGGPPAPVAPVPPDAPTPSGETNNLDILSEEGLAAIRKNLSNYGFTGQQGGMMDNDLEIFKNTILSQDGQRINEVFSATSSDPVNYAQLMKGGDDNGDADGDEFPDSDGEEDGEEEDEEEEEDDGQDGGVRRFITTEDDSSSSESASSDSDSDGDDSDSSTEITDSAIIVMHNSIDKAMDRRRNNSKYLKSNYTITSNSERNYKVDNKPMYSSQSSEYQSNHGSEYLNNLRNRDRLK